MARAGRRTVIRTHPTSNTAMETRMSTLAFGIIWAAAIMPAVGIGVFVLQSRLERWAHRRHCDD